MKALIKFFNLQKKTDQLLTSSTLLGLGLAIYGLWQNKFSAKMSGFSLLGVALTVWWPELTILTVFASSKDHNNFLLGMAGLHTSGPFFVALSAITLIVAYPFLVSKNILHVWKFEWNYPLLFLVIMTIVCMLNWMGGRIWVAKSEILEYYFIQGIFTQLILWYILWSQFSDLTTSGKRLLVAIVFVNIGGIILNMLLLKGSFLPLVDPYSDYWSHEESRLTPNSLNPITFSAEFLSPAFIACFVIVVFSGLVKWLRIIFISIIGILTILIIAAGSRQVILSTVIAIFVIFLLFDRNKINKRIKTIILLLIFAIPLYFFQSIFSQQFNHIGVERLGSLGGLDAESNIRIYVFQRDLNAFAKSPLIGQGLGFGATANNEYGLASHNLLTSIAAEIGIIPLISVIFFLYSTFRSLWKLAQWEEMPDDTRWVLQGITGLFILNLGTAMISGRLEGGINFFGYGTALYFFAESHCKNENPFARFKRFRLEQETANLRLNKKYSTR